MNNSNSFRRYNKIPKFPAHLGYVQRSACKYKWRAHAEHPAWWELAQIIYGWCQDSSNYAGGVILNNLNWHLETILMSPKDEERAHKWLDLFLEHVLQDPNHTVIPGYYPMIFECLCIWFASKGKPYVRKTTMITRGVLE